jgi:hypothetical protein
MSSPERPGDKVNTREPGATAKRLEDGTGMAWRVSRRERAPGLGTEVSAVSRSWHGVAVPYVLLLFGMDEDGKERLTVFRRHHSAALNVVASSDRCTLLAGPSREPGMTARVLAVLGLSQSEEAERLRKSHARAEWVDFRLAVTIPEGTKAGGPEPLPGGPTLAEVNESKGLLAAKGPNGGRHRGDPFLWFRRLEFCDLPPGLVTTQDRHGTEYVLLSDRPEQVMLSGSKRPRPWHLKRVYATTDPKGRPAVGMELDAAAAERMGALTGQNVGYCLAALFHGNAFTIQEIETRATDRLVVSGSKFDRELVARIVRSLSECMLAENETAPRR